MASHPSPLRWLAVLTALPLLLGCTEDIVRKEAAAYEQTSQAEMVGMSKEEAFTCLGAPKTAGNIWIYYFGTCVVNLSMEDGRVGAVNYSTRPPEKVELPLGVKAPEAPPTVEEQCAHVPEVGSCIRWLRSPE